MTNQATIDSSEHVTQRRMENLLAMSNRLCDAISMDIAALEKGDFNAIASTDPEIGRLCALYGREVLALKNSGGVKDMPAELVATLKASGERLRRLLGQHESLVICMRQASEGLVQAVAEEVEKTRQRGVPYSATPKPKRESSTGAIVYNKVV
jgi:hypothetical protein